jgi:ornithine carbamoyltransferase
LELKRLIKLAFEIKKNPDKFNHAIDGKTILMWFEKPSLRTRLSFEIAMTQLGGHAVYIDIGTTHKAKASLKDNVKCMSRFADIIMARVFDHRTIKEMIAYSDIPVINGLSDLYHPCQAIADIMTIQEFTGKDATVAYVGDGNNVCNSLIDACKMLNIKINVATPADYKPISKPNYWTASTKKTIDGADIVYTDTWISMGQEEKTEKKQKIFKDYQINKTLLGNRYFMHCLPAIREKEVTDEVIDSEKSLVYDQAENRLHVQKALIITLLEN